MKEIVTAHKGEVTCASEPGKGTTFRIVLPSAEPSSAERGTRNAEWKTESQES